MPAIKRNAAGTSSMPPEIARPLVQPPAMPAPISSTIAPKKAMTQRLTRLLPKISVHCLSGSQRHFQVRDEHAPQHPAEEHADQQNDLPSDARRHDEVEVHIVERCWARRFAESYRRRSRSAGCSQQTVAQRNGEHANQAQQPHRPHKVTIPVSGSKQQSLFMVILLTLIT